MKMIEVLISCALFIAITMSITSLLSSVQSFLGQSNAHWHALFMADYALENSATSTSYSKDGYSVMVNIDDVDNFTKKKTAKVSYIFGGRSQEANLSLLTTDTSESEGQSSCHPDQDANKWKQLKVSTFDPQTLGITIEPSDIDIVGHLAFVSSDASTASSSDLFIFDISDLSNIKLISQLDTGPGIAALQVVGNFVYVANTSVNAQLQTIDVSDLKAPRVISLYKLPGTYNDSTTIGNAIFYKSGKVFLGTQKSQISELHYIDVSDPLHPHELANIEIGNAINDLLAYKDKLYVASPHSDEMKAYTIGTNQLFPYSSFNNPGSTGNGKRLSLFLNTLYVGKTQTFNREELLALTASSSPTLIFGIPFGVSIEGVLGYGSLLFTLLHRTVDGFAVYGMSSSTPQRINTGVTLPAIPLNMDCDKDLFAIVSEGSPIITFITHT